MRTMPARLGACCFASIMILACTGPGPAPEPAPAPEPEQEAVLPEPEIPEVPSIDPSSALAAAAGWLIRHQLDDGHWDSDGWNARCMDNSCATWRGANADHAGAGWEDFDAGNTALAVLALIRTEENLPAEPAAEIQEAAARAVRWLIRTQKPDGSIGFRPGMNESIYNHGFGILALVEASVVLSPELPESRAAIEKAIAFAATAQNAIPNDPESSMGWKYDLRTGMNDTSVTACMVLALARARAAGFTVPGVAFRGAMNWFDMVTEPRTGLAGYDGPDGFSSFIAAAPGSGAPYYDFERLPTMTAAALAGRFASGEGHSDAIVKGTGILIANAPRGDERRFRNLYYWYYGTIVLRQATGGGGDAWERWRDAQADAILSTQRLDPDSCVYGAWDPDDEWGLAGGRVFTTAMAARILADLEL